MFIININVASLYKKVSVQLFFKKINNIKRSDALTIMPQASPSISAEVILKSESGRSMTSSQIPITSENVEEFRPSERVIKDATSHLKELGFAVSSNGLTLTLVGEKSLFEKVFKVKLTLKKNEQTRKTEIRSDKQSDKQLSIPARLSHIVENIVFTPQPELFS
jgi:hypothetical protein